jgi:hypothetical protein
VLVVGVAALAAVVSLTAMGNTGAGCGPAHPPAAPGQSIASSATQDLPDGFVVPDGNRYVVFLSSAFGDPHQNIPTIVGTPGHWSAPFDALPALPAWAIARTEGGLVWSPEVARFGDRWVMYFSPPISGLSHGRHIHCLGVATSASLTGPYTATDAPVVCQRNQGGDIDGQPVDAGGGRHVLVWKSDNNAGRQFGADTVWDGALSADGLTVTGAPRVVYSADVSPGWARPIVEAPQMVRAPDGTWWLIYSGGYGYATAAYGIGAARCGTLDGPCRAVQDTPLLATNRQGKGPGEETVYTAGGTSWVVYSPWYLGIWGKWFRPVTVARLQWCPSGPVVTTPAAFPETPTAGPPAGEGSPPATLSAFAAFPPRRPAR